MSTSINYGLASSLTLDLPPDALIADCGSPVGMTPAQLAEETAAVLAEPLGFPPLCQATVPGDRVALVVGEGVPQIGILLAAVIEELLNTSDPSAVSVLCTRADRADCETELTARLTPEHRARLEVVTHEPHDHESCAYVAATQNGDPIYLNRAIVDADVVVPIGCLRATGSAGYLGLHGTVFPRFSDEATQKRFRSVVSAEELERQCREVDQVGWLLGVLFTVQVVPGASDSVLHVLAGLATEVAARGSELCAAALRCELPQTADLVVATIDGGPQQQTWENMGRALEAAGRAVSEEGVVALCCDLAAAPGPALRYLPESETTEEALRGISRQRHADAVAATRLVNLLDQHPVFLLSRLDEETVEELGMACLADAEDLARLGQQFRSCIMLRGAQYLDLHLTEAAFDDEPE
jgi:nickel-dependent lactate racemase